MYARLRPNRSPILLPIRMNAAETRASSAIADWTPLTVVPRSWTTAEMDTFIRDVSTTSTNIAIASRSPSFETPAGAASACAVSAWAWTASLTATPCSLRGPPARCRSRACGGAVPQGRNDVTAVDLEDALLVAVHQVDVELVDAGVREAPELRDVIVDRAEHAEPVGDLVADEPGVGRPDLGVVQVVVALTVAGRSRSGPRAAGRAGTC